MPYKKQVRLIVICLTVLLSVTVSCAAEGLGETTREAVEQAASVVTGEEDETAVVFNAPRYGGTVTLTLSEEPVWDLLDLGKSAPHQLAFNRIWDGDWVRGPAGGYGTNETSWGESTNNPYLKTGHLAESWRIEINNEENDVTTILQIREGIRFVNIPGSDASALVSGRELTADDIVSNFNIQNSHPDSMNARLFPQVNEIKAVKTGQREVTISHPVTEHPGNILRLCDNSLIFAPELFEEYGLDFSKHENSVGTGPFFITDFVPGNLVSLQKNPDYWMNDPVGPGESNRLPYVENVKYIVVPDESTRQAALRAGNIDMLPYFEPEDSREMTSGIPELKAAERGSSYQFPIYMRTDLPPFNDIRVRRAMMMALDFNSINENLYYGLGDILSWPYYYDKAYAGLYLGLDDPDMPEPIKELYTCNPEKAGQLLNDSGYPTGFGTTLITTRDQADYYSILAAMWSEVGIEVTIEPVDSLSTLTGLASSREYQGLIGLICSPNSTFPEQAHYTGESWINASLIRDSSIERTAEEIRSIAILDFKAAMAATRELMKYLLNQAYVIPAPRYPQFTIWWPWLKNYSGETSVGYFPGDSWVQWVWVDQSMKRTMGY